MGIRVDDKNNVILVTFSGELGKDFARTLSREVNKLIARKKIRNIIFHLEDCLSAEEEVLHEMADIVHRVSRSKGSGRLLGVNNDIYKSLKETRLDRILLLRANFKMATDDMGFDFSDEQIQEFYDIIEKRVKELKTSIKEIEGPEEKNHELEKKTTPDKVDVHFINHFLLSTTKTLKDQFQTPSKPGKPFQKKTDDPFLMGDVCGLISIDSEYFQGTLSLSFPEKVFVHLVSNTFGEEVHEVTDENIDMVGEIANIVLGDAKSQLITKGYKVESALPHCIHYKDGHLHHQEGLSIVIPYHTDFGPFYTEVIEGKNIVDIQDRLQKIS